MSYTSEQLAAALEAAARCNYRPPPMLYSSLRPYRPPVPRKPATTPTTEIVRTEPYEAPVAVERRPVAPAAVERLGGISMQLDIAVERRRSFWWRLVAKLQFFRS